MSTLNRITRILFLWILFFWGACSYAATVNHIGLTSGCVICHNGQNFSGVIPTHKPQTHIPTALDCSWCHSASAWLPASVTPNLPPSPPPLNVSAAMLAKQMVGGVYQWSAKGWDWPGKVFVDSTTAKTVGYHWDSNNPSIASTGLDCSGLVFWSYNKASGSTQYQNPGVNLVHYEGADGQYRNNTVTVTEANLEPGDLLFFNNPSVQPEIDHVSMYIGCCGPNNTDVVSAASPMLGIRWEHKDILKQSGMFVAFGRVVSPKINIRFQAHSPIELTVTDPDGFTITPDTLITTEFERLREIPGVLYYSQSGLDANGKTDDTVYSPSLKTGNYLVHIRPKAGVLPTETYGLDVETSGGIITLAKDVQIANIPSQGYGITSSAAGVTSFIPINIDIKPSEQKNHINPKSQGKISVALLSSADFNVTTSINQTSLTFGHTGDEFSLLGCDDDYEDVNSDGLPDLVCRFLISKTSFIFGDSQGVLKGTTIDGNIIIGKDSIRVMPKSIEEEIEDSNQKR